MRPEVVLIALLLAAPLHAQHFAPVEVPPHAYRGGWEHFVGGGVAVFDCDGDALPELYVAGGTDPATLLRNASTRGQAVRFEQATPGALRLTGVTGAYPLDVDSDGLVDLAVLRVGENMLLRGLGSCAFAPFDLGFTTRDAWTTAFSATWEKGQSLPTMAFGNYVDRGDPEGPFEACDTHDLYRPEAESYTAPTALAPGFCALSMLFTDWGRKGRQDLRVSNDRHYYVRGGQEQLWAMDNAPRLYAEDEGWVKHELWGMGIASRDVTGDGLPDVFLTSMGDQRFQVAEGGAPTYRDEAYAHGLTAHRPFTGGDGRPSTGWHAVFGDVQNDGLDDLFVAKGNVEQMPDAAFDDPNNLLMQGPAGAFTEKATEAGVASMARGRGAALADLDLDGRLDLVVVNRRADMEVYRNVTTGTGRWLGLRLVQDAPNRNAVGAWTEVRLGGRVMAREVTVGGGHAGGSLGPEHFGLGEAVAAEVRVIWPDGTVSGWTEVAADGYFNVTRDGDAVRLSPY